MAIIMMTSEDEAGLPNVETVRDFRGHEAGLVRHSESCCHAKTDFGFGILGHEIRPEGLRAECITKYEFGGKTVYPCVGPFKPLYMKTTHVGLVLETGEYNGYDDSDFYAVVWNREKQHTERIIFATTRGWTYPNNAVVDATPEVKAEYNAWCERMRAKAKAEREAKEAATPRKGKTLEVVKGRKVPVGTRGICIWMGSGQYGERVGIKDDAGNVHWTAMTNVKVVEAK
jgi:hypothetical protein